MLGKIIVIGGASASRKNTLAKVLEEQMGIEEIKVYSTRPTRTPDETDLYLTELEYENLKKSDKFLLTSQHGNWFYGVLKSDFQKVLKNGGCLVATPSWIRKLKRTFSNSVTSFYLQVGMRYAFIQRLERGDEIRESYHRHCRDEGMFDGFENEVDYVLENEKFEKSSEELVKEIMKIIEEEKNNENLSWDK